MTAGEFVIDTPDDQVRRPDPGSTADFLLAEGYATSDREPPWHLRWCLERMAPGDSMAVGEAQVERR